MINDAIKYANGLESKGIWTGQSPKDRRRYLLSIANRMSGWEKREQFLYVIAEMTEEEVMKGLSDEQEKIRLHEDEEGD